MKPLHNNSIAEEMLKNLVVAKPQVSQHLNKIAIASQHLNNASDILDNLGLSSQANLLKSIVEKVAKNKLDKLNK